MPEAADWNRLEKAWKDNDHVRGMILDQVDRGFTVDLGGIVAFLPITQVDMRPAPDIASLKSAPQSFEIMKMDREQGTIVVSRRVMLETKYFERMRQLREGQVVEGVVDKVLDEGAFVDLGDNVIALLYSSDMAWRRVKHPAELVSIGQQITVKIVKIDLEGRRVWVGMKQLLADPWDGIEARFQVGNRLKGRVVNVTEYGAFAELEAGVEGLVHVSDMPSRRDAVVPDQDIEVQILDIDTVKRRISLRMMG